MTETVKLKDRHPWRQPVGLMNALNIVRGYAAFWGINLDNTGETAAVFVLVLLSVVFDVKVLIPRAEAKTTPLVDPRDVDGRHLTPENGLDQLCTAMKGLSSQLSGMGVVMEDAPEWFQDLLDEDSDVPDELEAPEDEVGGR